MGTNYEYMKKFFYPSAIAVFGVAAKRRNLARNIILNCQNMGYKGEIYPVGRKPGRVYEKEIITDPGTLPEGIDLAVILVPAKVVADTLEICGQKKIHRAVISTGGFSEYDGQDNRAEKEVLAVIRRHGIRVIGPNCIGVICPGSGLCTPFNPLQSQNFRKGPIGLIVQSGGVTTQCAYQFSDEHIGFSKIISMGNKLDLTETDFLEYLMCDEDTEQIHLYLESIENGRDFVRLARKSPKPIIVFKSNTTQTASGIAKSHTAALSNNDRIVKGALKQAGVVPVQSIHEMTICAKALRLPSLKGDRLAVISLSGGFSVILADVCEQNGFKCPALPRKLMDQIEKSRRGGVIRMSNPMDFGDVHDIGALVFTLENCLALEDIDGLVLSFMYEPRMADIFGNEIGHPKQMLKFLQGLGQRFNKPIALSFFAERKHIEDFKSINRFPVFNDPVESVRALRMLRDYSRQNN